MEIKEVMEYCIENANYFETKSSLLQKNNDGSFNFIQDLNFDDNIIKEIPFKIDTIFGRFRASNCDLKSFKNFPRIVTRGITSCGNSFESWDGWEIENAGEFINLCSPKSKLKDLNGLYDTKFEKLYLSVSNYMFENKNFINKIEEVISIEENALSYNNFKKLKNLNLVKPLLNIEDYIDFLNSIPTESSLNLISEDLNL